MLVSIKVLSNDTTILSPLMKTILKNVDNLVEFLALLTKACRMFAM